MPRGKKGKPPEELPVTKPVSLNPPSDPMPASSAGVGGAGTLTFGPIHEEFLRDQSEQIDFEGSRYSGKTWACCAKVIYSCRRHPGIIWQICRYSDEDSQKLLKPIFKSMCERLGEYPSWNAEFSAYEFANGSTVRVRGLRSQGTLAHLAKVRGLDVAGIWADQAEEIPEDIGTELPFGTRQPGYPHQTIFSPNPPPEEHWMSDFFPDDNHIPGRKYYCVSLYDNPHCPETKLAELERLYPPTHARYKTLVLGKRGPGAVGTPVYDGSFVEALHVGRLTYDPELPLMQAIHMGQHHPVWIAAQRNYFGGIEILGGVLGKRLFLEDFLPIIEQRRAEWFPQAQQGDTFCDPPASLAGNMRFTNINILRDAKLKPRYRAGSNSPDVREAVIQSIAGFMHRRLGPHQAFRVNDDPAKWLMASHMVVKQSKFFVDGLQANYVWDDKMVSVGNKLHRQPKEHEWVEGAQRCLENLMLHIARIKTQEDRDTDAKEAAKRSSYKPATAWG